MKKSKGKKTTPKKVEIDFGPDASYIESHPKPEIENEEEYYAKVSSYLERGSYPSYRHLLKQGKTEPFAPTDMGNAQRFIALHGRDLLFDNQSRKWMVWDGKKWTIDIEQKAMRMAKETIPKLQEEWEEIQKNPPLDWNALKMAAFAANMEKSQSRGKLKAMVDLAQPDLSLHPDQWDSDRWLFNCINGTIELKSGELNPHYRHDWITKIAPVGYDPKATSPTWIKFVYRIMGGNARMIDYLRRAVGYGLTGSQKEQVFFLLVGSGANGKSTFLETLREILGDYARSTPFATFLKTNKETIRGDIARLKGARFVTASEPEKGRGLAESIIKVLTGEDKITARLLYQNYFEYQGTFKIFLAANHRPDIQGTDHAIWRRVRVIPFTIQIPENEQDKDLKRKLLNEREGILRWAVGGCLAWQNRGLGHPPEIEQAIQDYRRETDTMGDFLEECCVQGEEEKGIQSKYIYAAFREWCKENGIKPIPSHKSFGTELGRRVEKRKGKSSPRYYLHISLRNEWLDKMKFKK